MMVWIALAAMTVAVIAILAAPLLRRGGIVAPRAAHDLEVYREQLAEIERDRARGTLSDAEGEAARAEIARRALAAANELPAEAAAPQSSARVWPIAAAVAAPVAALAFYVGVAGSPGLPGQPFAARPTPPADTGRQVVQMVETLAARLKENPNDLDGWAMLARSYGQLERNADAVVAWRKVMELSNNADAHAAALAESLVREADGMVTPEARRLFERVKTADPRDPRAGFYLGIAYAQEGDARQALQTWTDLVAASPPDAPWLAAVRERIQRAAAGANIDPASIVPSQQAVAAGQQQRGPSAADVAAIQRMSPEQRTALVRGMVGQLAARLENEPGDLEGWRRLGRAYQVLGETDNARQAWQKAVALAPERADVLAEYGTTLLGDRAPDEKLPAEFVTVMRRVLELDGENGDALWFVGLAELELGNKDAAIALWDKLIGRLPPNSPAYAEIKQQLDKLRSAN
jgi:cytochrome c-type biogenesis protein CcmH